MRGTNKSRVNRHSPPELNQAGLSKQRTARATAFGKILREKLRAQAGPWGPAAPAAKPATGENGVSPHRLGGGSRGASKTPGRPRAPSEPESRRDDGTGETGSMAETRRERSRGLRQPDIRIQRAISETIPGSTGRGLPPLDLKTFRGKRGQSSALRGG